MSRILNDFLDAIEPMMFWKRYNHPLPRFPSGVIPTFRAGCEQLSVEDANNLKPYIAKRLKELKNSEDRSQTVNYKLAEEIARACLNLIRHYDQLEEREQRKVVGAIRYFAIAHDPFPDEAFASGLHDDARVINHVLEVVGIEDSYVDIPY